jgi:hypothetical protein
MSDPVMMMPKRMVELEVDGQTVKGEIEAVSAKIIEKVAKATGGALRS